MKTCLIIGNGPSLAGIPNEFLGKYPTFGSNRVYLKYTPDYYAFCDPLWLGRYLDDIIALKCKEKFIHWRFATKVPGSKPLFNLGYRKEFSFEPLTWIHDGNTVTFVHLQLAYHYGFERALLIGVDHHYGYEGQPATQQTGKEDAHFTPDYYDDDVTYWKPDLTKTTRAYKMAKKAYKSVGREIINITPGTHLDVFEKGDWHDW